MSKMRSNHTFKKALRAADKVLRKAKSDRIEASKTPKPISNDLINIQEEIRLLNELNEVIDNYRDGRVTRVQVIGILHLLQQEIIGEVDE